MVIIIQINIEAPFSPMPPVLSVFDDQPSGGHGCWQVFLDSPTGLPQGGTVHSHSEIYDINKRNATFKSF